MLATVGAGAADAARIYRLLLQAGADTGAVATVPAAAMGGADVGDSGGCSTGRGGGSGDGMVSVVPSDMAGVAAVAEVGADSARHVMECHLSQESTNESLFDDVSRTVHQSLGGGAGVGS